jgi:hypothetical protein
MTNNEKEMIDLIRNNENPVRAYEIVLELILACLTPNESFASTTLACPQEHA